MKNGEQRINNTEGSCSVAFINNIKFTATRECVITQSAGIDSCKDLTVRILDASAPALMGDTDAMDAVIRCVDEWIIENRNDYSEIKWQADLIRFATEHSDVTAVYASGKDAEGYEFVLVMDDITSDNVFEYNEFCFEFAEKYEQVTDFMVIDVEEAQGCHDLLDSYNIIYSRR